ncbi:MAG: hypothetical protein M1822_007453 [Bathelium mastoideum]|nr:MAG: hypothetical protein M1822_007453 [Bathelium mastoideum]
MTSSIKTHQNGYQNVKTTQILPVDSSKTFKNVSPINGHASFPDDWDFELDEETADGQNLRKTAAWLKHSDVPVAFPTETVYGLGADATRSEAVKGIYKAKQRPADNPLIVHVCSLNQLRQLLLPLTDLKSGPNGTAHDLIPDIYKSLIQKFWPGPLTILLPNPDGSRLAPEVTAGLPTFGARMPNNLLAMALIKQAGVPLAAPSANASTRPSPTAAEHVYDDLNGRIDMILDGGPCDVGVESTVVDGLSDPPCILRPGGISIDQLRLCPGWENVIIGYKDTSEKGSAPKAPGMKYRHYSPRAKVILYDAGQPRPNLMEVMERFRVGKSIGCILTKNWEPLCQYTEVGAGKSKDGTKVVEPMNHGVPSPSNSGFGRLMQSTSVHASRTAHRSPVQLDDGVEAADVWEISLRGGADSIARGLFAALRELDKQGVHIILVEGIDEHEGARAAAIMNRLRKAAEMEIR